MHRVPRVTYPGRAACRPWLWFGSLQLPESWPGKSHFLAVESPKSPVFTRGLLSAGRRRFQDMSPFDTIAKTVYRRPLTVYLLSILVPVALTLALVRARGKTHIADWALNGTPFLCA